VLFAAFKFKLGHYRARGVFAALGVGALLYWLVERPFLKLRDRLHRRSNIASTVAPTPLTPPAIPV
jgi:peptidoglycan/LPS O-acetylase OafA/YrhL